MRPSRNYWEDASSPAGKSYKEVLLSADDQVVSPDVDVIFLKSDNTTATNRTFTLLDGQIRSQELLINFSSGSSNTADLQSGGNVQLVEAWQPLQYECLKLQWDGTQWCEVSRSETALVAGSIVNADINASAAIAYSKLNLSASVLSTDMSLTDSAMKMARYTVAYDDLTGAGDGVAYVAGVSIPDNSIIYQVIRDVTTTFVGDNDDSSTISIGLEDQDNDVLAAIAISDVSNPHDVGIQACIQVGTAATAIKLSAARQLATTWDSASDTTLSAGQMDVYVFYVTSST